MHFLWCILRKLSEVILGWGFIKMVGGGNFFWGGALLYIMGRSDQKNLFMKNWEKVLLPMEVNPKVMIEFLLIRII